MSTGPTDPLGPMTLERVYELLQVMRGETLALDQRVQDLEAKHYDTAPSWANALADQINKLRTETQTGFGDLRQEMRVMNRDIHHVKSDLAALEQRIERVEEKH